MTANENTPTPLVQSTNPSEFELLLAKDSKIKAQYTPYGGQQKIDLSVGLIRRYIAPKYKLRDGAGEVEASDEECVRFLLMCRNRGLDPWTGDAYMVPFWDSSKNGPSWSLITSHASFLKRAETHVDFDGMDSGIIVKDADGKLVEREGDFLFPGDQLLGGWATVFKKTKAHPKKIKVNLSVYIKGFGVWKNDPAGMICKVAEAQAIRDSFPSQTGDLYLREEMKDLPDFIPAGEVEKIKAPAIAAPAEIPGTKKRDSKGRPTLVDEPLNPKQPPIPPDAKQQPPQAQQTTPPAQPEPEKTLPATPPTPPAATVPPPAAPAPQPTATPPTPAPQPAANPANPEEQLLNLAKANNISEEQLKNYLFKDKWLKPPQTKISEMSVTKIQTLVNHFTSNPPEFAKRIMSKQ